MSVKLGLTLREEHKVREKVKGGWRRLHNEGPHNLYTSANVIRVIKSRMRWAGHIARFGRPRHRWEDSIRMYFKGTVWEVVD
jgi:hypothetical protein